MATKKAQPRPRPIIDIYGLITNKPKTEIDSVKKKANSKRVALDTYWMNGASPLRIKDIANETPAFADTLKNYGGSK